MARMRSSVSGISFTRPCCWSDSSAAETWPLASNLDGGFQRRVFLANDLVELGGAHSGLLQLLEGAARFDALMLAGVADQEHAVVGAETRKELAHLVGAGKARFIDKVEVPLFGDVPGCASVQGTLAGFLTRRQPRQVGGRRGRSGRSPRPGSPAIRRRCG